MNAKLAGISIILVAVAGYTVFLPPLGEIDLFWDITVPFLKLSPVLAAVYVAIDHWRQRRHTRAIEELRARKAIEFPQGATHINLNLSRSYRYPNVVREEAPIIDVEQTPPPLPLHAWLPQLINHPGHVLLLGGTGDGKSTLANALLTARSQTDRIVALDPHGGMNPWCLPKDQVIGTGLDYAAIDRMTQTLLAEFLQRGTADRKEPPISIFLDEFPSIAKETEQGSTTVIRLVREARKYGMRLIIMSTGAEVKALGIEGEGSVRESFLFVHLGAFATTLIPEAAEQSYPAALTRGMGRGSSTPRLIDMTGVPGLVGGMLPPNVIWQPDPALLLADSFSSSSDDGPDSAQNGIPTKKKKRKTDFSPDQCAEIRERKDAGERKSHACKAMFGTASGELWYAFSAVWDEDTEDDL